MKEYGGYLPLELNERSEYFRFGMDSMLRVNCGRSAILCAIADGGYAKVHLPLYTCRSVSEALIKRDIPFSFYHIDKNFRPVNVSLKNREVLLWTNYFGIGSQTGAESIAAEYRNVILDNTQAFFAGPVMDVYNVYSCRKFFGVSDGAYLIHNGICRMNLEKDYSAQAAQYLLDSVERGTNGAYQGSLANEKRIEETDILGMSELTQRILRSVDYEMVKQRRKKNFWYLHERLKGMNQLEVLNGCGTFGGGEDCADGRIPMVYPFLYECEGLREYLISCHIYVPQWWKWVVGSGEADAFELMLSQHLFALPIDQRYGEADMEEMCGLILGYVAGKGHGKSYGCGYQMTGEG